MSSTFDENIDPVLCAIDPPIIPPQPTTSPAVLPDGSLVSKPDFEAHLYVHMGALLLSAIRSPASLSLCTHNRQTLKHKTPLRAACEELNISFAHRTTLAGFREKLVNHW
jgi:hypothetical protein